MIKICSKVLGETAVEDYPDGDSEMEFNVRIKKEI